MASTLRRARCDELAKTVDAEIVNGPRALQLAQADERHLHQPALVSSVEIGVRLDAVDEDDAVRLVNVPIHEDPNGSSPRGSSSTTSIEERTGAPTIASEMPYSLQDLGLSFGRRSAVAAHCGHDERMGAAGAHVRGDSRTTSAQVVDAATAGGDRDACARSNQVVRREAAVAGSCADRRGACDRIAA